MMDQPSDSGYELVLDNRRLIIAFAVLILICGCFFVVGFMEGKRQGLQSGSQATAEPSSKPDQASEPAASETPASRAKEEEETAKAKQDERPLEWYKSVSGQGEKPQIAPPVAASNPEPKAAVPKPVPVAPKPAVKAAAAPSGYSVQVGAFRQKQQVDNKAEVLRSKGFDCRIEPPATAEGLYLLKVGRFKSRAEAVAMQLRLKKEGISSFIKTN